MSNLEVPEFLGVSGVAWITIALLIIQIGVLQFRIIKLEGTRPHVVFHEFKKFVISTIKYKYIPRKGINGKIKGLLPYTPSTTSGSWLDIQKEAHNVIDFMPKTKKGNSLEIFSIGFKNEKIKRQNTTDANGVYAEIEILTKDLELIKYSDELVWRDSKPKASVNLLVDKNPEYLYLAARSSSEKQLYFYDRASYTKNYESFSIQENINLQDNEYYFHVKLNSGNLADIWIHLINGDEPEFKTIQNPLE